MSGKKFYFLIFIFIFSIVANAREVSILQLLFTAKKVFPEMGEISILIPKDIIDSETPKIERSAAQAQLKVKLYPVKNTRDIGTHLKQIPDNSILLVYNAPILKQKSSRMFILSKSKAKNISIISASREFTDQGALLGLFQGETKTELVINLKHSEFLAEKFTESFLVEIKAKEIIQ